MNAVAGLGTKVNWMWPQADQSGEEIDLPPRLRGELSRLYQPSVAVAPEIDRAILAGAKQSLVRRRRGWMWASRLGIGAAAAAMLAIALHLFIAAPAAPRQTALVQHPRLSDVADVNHDGRVDILDAYTLARKIAHHEPLDPAWDINGDGVVDQKDVDLIATLAVRAGSEAKQ